MSVLLKPKGVLSTWSDKDSVLSITQRKFSKDNVTTLTTARISKTRIIQWQSSKLDTGVANFYNLQFLNQF